MQQGYAGPAAWDTYALTVSWLAEVGQGYIQAAYVLGQASQASVARGDAVTAYLQSVGAQMAMQVQAMPPGERRQVERDVPLGALSAHVVVTGDLGDGSGQAGFVFELYDPDPQRTALIAQAGDYAHRAEEAQAAGNQLLAYLHNCQARVDVAYANLPPGARTDKMLDVAQRFVRAAYDASGRGDWNLVQTLEIAADVSLQIAELPEGQRHRMTERFMHESVKHDITVNPDDLDPFATFTDHSKGEDVIGAIVEAVVGVVINVLAVIPVTAPVFAPIAVAWDVAQAGKAFAEGNILGGVLNLAAAAGVGLSGLAGAGAASQPGSFAADANAFARSIGFVDTTTQTVTSAGTVTNTVSAAQHLGSTILDGVAVVGGASGIAQAAQRGDVLGIAAGMLQVAAGIAGGLVDTGALAQGGALAGMASNMATVARLGSVGLSVSDAFLHGDLIGGLSTSLNVLLAQVAKAVQTDGGAQAWEPATDDEEGYWPPDAAADVPDSELVEPLGANVPPDLEWMKAVQRDPSSLVGKSAQELASEFTAHGYSATTRSSRGSGLSDIVVIERGSGSDVTQIEVHPGGGRHNGAYVKISTSTQRTLKYVDPTTYQRTGPQLEGANFYDIRTNQPINQSSLPIRGSGAARPFNLPTIPLEGQPPGTVRPPLTGGGSGGGGHSPIGNVPDPEKLE